MRYNFCGDKKEAKEKERTKSMRQRFMKEANSDFIKYQSVLSN